MISVKARGFRHSIALGRKVLYTHKKSHTDFDYVGLGPRVIKKMSSSKQNNEKQANKTSQ